MKLDITAIILKIKTLISNIKSQFLRLFIEDFPGKKMLKIFKVFKYFGSFLLLTMIGFSFFTSSSSNSSFYEKAQFEEDEGNNLNDSERVSLNPNSGTKIKGVNYGSKTSHEVKTSKVQRSPIKVNYKATQVIVRKDEMTSKNLPTGTSAIGKLLTDVDTRISSGKLIRVLLTNGINYQGKSILPKKTIILGQSEYPSQGKRVFLNFSLAILPSGEEVQLQASALDYNDFSPGIMGKYHSAFKNRVAATAGLSFLTGFSETLQEREVLSQDLSAQQLNSGLSGMGGFGQVTKKANLKNAMLSGLSEFSQTEGAIQLQELQSKGPYVRIKAGGPIIITLNQRLEMENK